MAEAPQQAHLPSHTPGEIGTHFESSPYDELAASRNGQQRCRFVDEYVITAAPVSPVSKPIRSPRSGILSFAVAHDRGVPASSAGLSATP